MAVAARPADLHHHLILFYQNILGFIILNLVDWILSFFSFLGLVWEMGKMGFVPPRNLHFKLQLAGKLAKLISFRLD